MSKATAMSRLVIEIEKPLRKEFRRHCRQRGTSMTYVLTDFVKQYLTLAAAVKPPKSS